MHDRPPHTTRIAPVIVLASAAAAFVVTGGLPGTGPARAADTTTAQPIAARHVGASRATAAERPRSEADQTLHEGWPLYRTERGQQAFNAAMATLAATEGKPPAAQAFKGCAGLRCPVALPALSADGWLPAGRLWLSPDEYVLVAHSPRLAEGRSWRRRSARHMRYFVLHEFHNSTRNNDVFDTVSSHSGSVFVPLYLSKTLRDARGRRLVIVLQVAPTDVQSIHATNMGSAGPGIEVAKSARDELEPLQATAGIVVATIVKAALPRLEVVNHGGQEGRPMLDAYEERLAALAARPAAARVTLPFVPASPQRVAAANAPFAALLARAGLSPPIPVAERGFAPPVTLARAGSAPGAPQLVGAIRPAVRPSAAALSSFAPQLMGPITEAQRPTRPNSLRGAVAR